METDIKYIPQSTFSYVISAMITLSITINGFMWSNIQSQHEYNIRLRGEMQTLNARILPVDKAVTRETFELSRDKQDETINRFRETANVDIERLRTHQIMLEKHIAALCAISEKKPFACDN